MKNLDQRNQIIEYSLKLNSTNLSPLRSGNISLRSEENGTDGYLITPSGKKYETLKPEDIVFMGLNEEVENNEIKKVLIYPNNSKAMNLAFDVTPAKYVTGLITEKGICEASEKGLKGLFK